jgi:hypothetical protein
MCNETINLRSSFFFGAAGNLHEGEKKNLLALRCARKPFNKLIYISLGKKREEHNIFIIYFMAP